MLDPRIQSGPGRRRRWRAIGRVWCALVFAGWTAAEGTVRINEFMASNGRTLADEDGDYEDWIELHNSGAEPVNLAGWGLTDDRDQPFQWVFPEVWIAPGGFLMVYTSGKDRREYGDGEFRTDIYPALQAGTATGAAGIWRFEEAAGDTALDASGNGNHGTLHGAVRVPTDHPGPALQFISASNSSVEIPNRPSLQTTNSMTLAMWLKPESLGTRQNPWDKAYGGEGTLTLEADGRLTFYWGTAGDNAEPYQSCSSSNALAPGEWTHIAVARDHRRGLIRWYFNGEAVAVVTNVPVAAKASSRPLRIGTGYAGAFAGRIARPVLLPYAFGDARLHANFRINNEGEWLQLTRPDGTVAEQVAPVGLWRDMAYGRHSADDSQWRYYPEATPGRANQTAAYLSILAPPVFASPGGRYADPLDLALSHPDPDVRIVYTLDGSTPDTNKIGGQVYRYKIRYPQEPGDPFGETLSGTARSFLYTNSIQIADRSAEACELAAINTAFTREPAAPGENPMKATVVRACAYKEGHLPSSPRTQTYFVGAGLAGRYGLPVISLATAAENLFGYDRGLYVPGRLADEWRTANPQDPRAWKSVPGNYTQRGQDWERAGHVEIYDTNGLALISQPAGIRIHGSYSRSFPLKSLRLYPQDESGRQSTSFDYPLFPGRRSLAAGNQPITSFDSLLLRQSGEDWDRAYYTDAFLQELVRHVPLLSQAYRPAVHFVNGVYWGLINLRERRDEHWLAAHYAVEPDEAVILSFGGYSVDTGETTDRFHFAETVAYVEEHCGTDLFDYDWVCTRVDVDNFALYYAIQLYYDNLDWPQNNHELWRKRTAAYLPQTPCGHDGRWRWLLTDLDVGFGFSRSEPGNSLRRVVDLPADEYAIDVVSNIPANRLFRTLVLHNRRFRDLFVNASADLMNSAFVPERATALLQQFEAGIASHRAEHNRRWQVQTAWQPAMLAFASNRPAMMRQHIREQFGLAGPAAITVHADPAAGRVQLNSLVIDADLPGHPTPETPYPWTGIYFPGVPVRLTARPEPGYRFAGWQEYPEETAPVLEVNPADGMTITALFEELPQSHVIHYWNFNSTASLLAPAYTLVPSAGISIDTGTASVATSGTGQDFWGENARFGDPAGAHLRLNNPIGAMLDAALPTTGFADVVVKYETRRSGSGAGLQTVSYTTNGAQYLAWPEPVIVTEVPTVCTFDFSAIPGAADNPDFGLRVEFAAGGAGTSGNNRFDNWTIEGVPLGEFNLPPAIAAPVAAQELVAGAAPVEFDLQAVFADPDGDPLVFQASSDAPVLAAAEATGATLRITPRQRGGAVVTLTADDGRHAPVATSFRVLVYPEAHVLAGGEYRFEAWDPDLPEKTYPEHMLFLQSEQNDSVLDTPLGHAYYIAHDDYHADDADTIGFPYHTTGRTRLNGLGADGIAFINTGRSRDLGGALLALDTRHVSAAAITWLGGTVLTNSRAYAIRLQYRVGAAGDFLDVCDAGGQPVEYVRNAPGHVQPMGPVLLPGPALGRAYVQVLWRYYWTAPLGPTGARDQLRLDDIAVAGSAPDFASFAAWRQSEFTAAEQGEPAFSGPRAEPDEPGVANLLRYGFGLSRTDVYADYRPRGTADGSGAFYQHRRLSAPAQDIAYQIETAPDLQAGTWLPANLGTDLEEVAVVSNGDGVTETVHYRLRPGLPAAARFLRLRVILAP